MKDLNIPEEQFLEAYISSGFNARRAYLTLKPEVTEDTAKTMGSRYLQKIRKGEILGVFLEKIFRNIDTLLDSDDERIKFVITKLIIEKMLPKDDVQNINPIPILDIKYKEETSLTEEQERRLFERLKKKYDNKKN